ncbi:MAG: hypothetical protein RIT45_2022 [Pseudomonadota bacterium]|jgi:hypothetical protein
MTRYRLRAGLRLGTDANGRAVLQDPQLRRALRLGPDDARLVRAIGGKGERFDALVGRHGDAEALSARLSGLARLFLLDGPRSALRLRLGHREEPPLASVAPDVPLHWPRGVDPPRHRCVERGACCSSSFLGPMTAADRVRVEGLTMGRRSRVPHGVDAIELLEHAGREFVGMARVGGQCVAQGDDGLCDVHDEHGYDVKPVPCRQFPLRFHRSPAGVHVSLLLACEGYAEGRAAQTDAWPSREAEVRGLLAEGAVAVPLAWPPAWSGGVPAEADVLLAALNAAFEASEAEPVAEAALRSAASTLAAAATRACDALREGPEIATPARFSAALTPLDPAAWRRDVLRAQAEALRVRSRDLAGRDEPADATRLERLAAVVETLPGRDDQSGLPCDSVAERLLRDVVANDLPAAVAVGPLDEGVAALARRVVVARAASRWFAEQAGLDHVGGQEATLGLKLVTRSEHDVAALADALRD